MSKENKFAYIAGAAAFLEVIIYSTLLLKTIVNHSDSYKISSITVLFLIFLAALGFMLFIRKIQIGLLFPVIWFIISKPISLFVNKSSYHPLYEIVQTAGWVFLLILLILAISYKPGQSLGNIKVLAIIPCILFALSGCVEFFEYRFYEFRMYESAFLWGSFRFFFRSVFLDFIITLFMGLWIREKLKAKSSTALPTELI